MLPVLNIVPEESSADEIVLSPELERCAQASYEAFLRAAEPWVPTYATMPDWDRLPGVLRVAWAAAAQASLESASSKS